MGEIDRMRFLDAMRDYAIIDRTPVSDPKHLEAQRRLNFRLSKILERMQSA